MFKIVKINQLFRKIGEFEIRYRFVLLAIILIVTILGALGLRKAIFSATQGDWFTKNDPMTIQTEKFEDLFGNNDNILILVESDNVFQPEVLSMIRNLGDELLNNVPYADDITSLTELEVSIGTEEGLEIINPFDEEIPEDPARLEEIKNLILSKKSFRNKIVSSDATETWILISMLEYPPDEEWKKESALDPLYQSGEVALPIINDEKWKSDYYTIKAAGMPVTETEEKAYMGKEMAIRVLSCFIMMIVLLTILLRSFRGVFVPVFTTIAGIMMVFGCMSWLGIKIDSMLVTLPVLLGIALSVGYSIHLVNAFKSSFRKQGNRREAVLSAIEHTGWPMFFTVITTVGSLLSFATVGIKNISWLGFTCAAVVVTVYFYVVTLIPILMSFGKDKVIQPSKSSKKNNSDQWFRKLGEVILKFRVAVALGFTAVLFAFTLALPSLTVNIDNFKFMGLKIPYVRRAYEIVNAQLGSYMSYNMTLDFGQEDAAKNPENLKKFDLLLQEMGEFEMTKKNEGVAKVFSILDIVKDLYQTLNEDNEAYYIIPDNQNLIAQLLFLYEMSGGTRIDDWVNNDYSVLRTRVDCITFNANVMVNERAKIEKRAAELFPDAKLGLVGSAMQFSKLNSMIVTGELKSFLTALLIISLLLIIVFASLKTGLIGMIPNLTPVIAVGGFMGFFNINLDMMTMTIMPMLLGIAVDDTIHFINNIKYEFEKTGSYREAILNSFSYVGKTLAMTTVVLIAAFSMYIPSTVNSLTRMGLLASIGLGSALIADYLMTPVLILWTKPFGKEKAGGK